ncbi:hypothetical protein IFM89_025801, partial [Coptis chinensis]
IMKINMRMMKIIPVEVMESNTIRKLKANFSKMEGVSMMNLKKLFFGANSLDSDKKLVDYGIKEDKQRLYIGEVKLENDATLADSSIPRGQTLSLISGMRIFVKSLAGKKLKLNVLSSDTCNDVKEMIHQLEGIPPKQQRRLVFNGKAFEDSRTVGNYNVEDGNTINLVPCLCGCQIVGLGGWVGVVIQAFARSLGVQRLWGCYLEGARCHCCSLQGLSGYLLRLWGAIASLGALVAS